MSLKNEILFELLNSDDYISGEELAEKQLQERRKDKVNKFRLFSPDDIGASSKDTVIKDEYHNEDKKGNFISRLEGARKSEKTVILLSLPYNNCDGGIEK